MLESYQSYRTRYELFLMQPLRFFVKAWSFSCNFYGGFSVENVVSSWYQSAQESAQALRRLQQYLYESVKKNFHNTK